MFYVYKADIVQQRHIIPITYIKHIEFVSSKIPKTFLYIIKPFQIQIILDGELKQISLDLPIPANICNSLMCVPVYGLLFFPVIVIHIVCCCCRCRRLYFVISFVFNVVS